VCHGSVRGDLLVGRDAGPLRDLGDQVGLGFVRRAAGDLGALRDELSRTSGVFSTSAIAADSRARTSRGRAAGPISMYQAPIS
jgi:hypothetical protein